MDELKPKTVSRKKFNVLSRIFEIGLIIIGVSFFTLASFAKSTPYFPLDLKITLYLQSIQNPIFSNLLLFLTELGNPIPAIGITILLSIILYIKKWRKEMWTLIFSLFGSILVSTIAKILIGRVRPDPNLIHQVGQFIYSDSFPSGHVLMAVGLYGAVFYLSFTLLKNLLLRTILNVVCVLILILMGVSRIYLGAHWFSDVIGAYLLGIIWLYIVVKFHQFLINRYEKP